MMPFAIIACLLIALLALGVSRERRLMRPYWQRACTGKGWRQHFPTASKTDIRQFLTVFIQSFGFPEKRRFCFTPDDRVMDVYHSLYPATGLADSMELEAFVSGLRKHYRVEILEMWREDITLGELFRQVKAIDSTE